MSCVLRVLEALIAGQVDVGVFSMTNRTFADQVTQAIAGGKVAQSNCHVVTADDRGAGLILMKDNEVLCQSINEIIADLMEKRLAGFLLGN